MGKPRQSLACTALLHLRRAYDSEVRKRGMTFPFSLSLPSFLHILSYEEAREEKFES